jgi:heme/copper-type cytochrome/quinol oxidase subunit 2
LLSLVLHLSNRFFLIIHDILLLSSSLIMTLLTSASRCDYSTRFRVTWIVSYLVLVVLLLLFTSSLMLRKNNNHNRRFSFAFDRSHNK